MFGNQQQRPEWQRNLPQWQLQALDRREMDKHRDRGEHPAIWEKLVEIDAKLDRLLKAVSITRALPADTKALEK